MSGFDYLEMRRKVKAAREHLEGQLFTYGPESLGQPGDKKNTLILSWLKAVELEQRLFHPPGD